MDVYEPLPIVLKSSLKDGIQPSVKHHLKYLWRAAHAVSSSTFLANSLSRRFIDLAIKCGLKIPEQVTNRLCTWCSAILLPTISSTVKVQSRGRRSKVHRKKYFAQHGDSNQMDTSENPTHTDSKARRKLKNQVVTKCNLCSHISHFVSGCERQPKTIESKEKTSLARPSSLTKDLKVIDDHLHGKSSAADNDAIEKFSFLQKANRRASAPGRMAEEFIPLNELKPADSNTGNAGAATKSGLTFFQKAKLAATLKNETIRLENSKEASMTAALSAKLGIVTTDLDANEQVGQKRPLTLLELEEKNKRDKKTRRKTIEKNPLNNTNACVPTVGYEISKKGSSASLSSLQSIFRPK